MRRYPLFAVAILLALTSTLFSQRGGFPRVRVPAGNQITPNKILLGKALFFEEQMSSSSTMACATCHGFKTGGSDARSKQNDSVHPGRDGRFGNADDKRGSKGVISHRANGNYRRRSPFGVNTQVTERRPMTAINAALNRVLFWDGRAGDIFRDPANGTTVLLSQDAALETQASGPPVSDVEMAHNGETWAGIATRIAAAKPLALASNIPTALATFVANKTYPQLFTAAFGTSAVTPARIAMAIATYERTLISNQSRFDDFQRGNMNALNASERRGFDIFRNRCDGCHSGPLTTDNQFHNTGVRPTIEDVGRQVVTQSTADRGKFRTPTIRNVALRAPYFHNGQMATLMDVVNFYNRGGDFNDNKDQRIRRLRLSSGQRTDLVNFMMALTDPRVAAGTAPFDSPTLYTQSTNVPISVGAGTAGTGSFFPEMIAIEPVFLGNPNLTFGVRNGLGGALAVFVVGANTTSAGVPVGGANIHVALGAGLTIIPTGALSGSGAGKGFDSISFSIPSNPIFIGATVGVQWVIGDTGAGKIFSATAAARVKAY